MILPLCRPFAIDGQIDQSMATITFEALITAYTSFPLPRPRFSADSLVMIEISWSPPASSMTISALIAPRVTFTTLPFKTFLALIFIYHPLLFVASLPSSHGKRKQGKPLIPPLRLFGSDHCQGCRCLGDELLLARLLAEDLRLDDGEAAARFQPLGTADEAFSFGRAEQVDLEFDSQEDLALLYERRRCAAGRVVGHGCMDAGVHVAVL